MLIVNHFRLIGIVYDDAEYRVCSNGLKITKFVLVVKNDISKPKEKTYLPIYVKGNEAVIAAHKCRNGNVVAVNGRIETKTILNSETGHIEARVMFIAEDNILVISKAKKEKLYFDKPKVITDWFCPDEMEEINDESKR